MKIYNSTPHSINIIVASTFKFDASIRKFVTDNPEIELSIPAMGMLNAQFEEVLKSTSPVKIKEKKIVGVDPLPEGYDIYIVSALYATAYGATCGNMDKLYTVCNPVYSLDGRTIFGCECLMEAGLAI
jgi:hypothetical protein